MGAAFNVLGEPYSLVLNGPFGSGMFFRHHPRNLINNRAPTLPQSKAQYACASAAHANIGTLGTTSYKGKNVPAIAAKVGNTVPQGKATESAPGVHGGMSKSQRRASQRVPESRMAALAAAAQGIQVTQPLY